MKTGKATIFAVMAASLLGAAAQPPAVVAKNALDLLLASKYTEFSQLLNAAAKEKLTPEFLRDQVGVEVKQFGTLQEIGPPISAKAGDTDILSFPVRFSNATVNVQLTLDA